MLRYTPIFSLLFACNLVSGDDDEPEPTCECPTVEEPVCADGVTYSNDCAAECEGITDYTAGAWEDGGDPDDEDEPSNPSCEDGRPGPDNTGPITAKDALIPYTGSYKITEPGVTLEGYYFEGTVTIQADNVTLRDFEIRCGDGLNGSWYCLKARDGAKNLVVEDGLIHGAMSSLVYGDNITLRRVELHTSGSDALKVQWNSVIENNWIHHPLGIKEGSHADGAQLRAGGNMTFSCNHFDIPIGEPGSRSNACLILSNEVGTIDNIAIDSNWCNGGNYSVYVREGDYGCPSQVAVSNNHFGRDFRFGLMSSDCGQYSCGNTWDDNGQPVSNGEAGGFVQDDETCP